jgi:lipopolysaccharide/colanic/teichoic acid biosynthesis glycosyltransferase
MYTAQFEGIEKIILSVRPGITDMSSIRFINLDEIVGETNADEMFEKYVLKRKNELRVKYVLEQSFILDIQLFMLTVWRVVYKALMVIFRKRGTVDSGKNTTEKL